MYKTKWRARAMTLLLISLNLTGCASPRVGVEYCEHARAIYFDTLAQVDATPAAIQRQVLAHNKTVARLCF
jgi:hypothetical protein